MWLKGRTMSSRAKVEFNNSALLTWARESGGYSLEDIAHFFNKSVDDIAAWERGEDAPTYPQLERLANKLKRPIAVFFLPEAPVNPPPPSDFRSLKPQTNRPYAPESLLAFRKARNRLAEARELLEALDIPMIYPLPKWSADEHPEVKAKELRTLLGVSLDEQIHCRDRYAAMDLWRSVLFDHGVVVLVFQLPLEDVRAFCLFDMELAAIGLSSKDPEYGRIFSTFHEVAHLCINAPGASGNTDLSPIQRRRTTTARIEDYCDRFAAAFVLPSHEKVVREALRSLAADLTIENGRYLANRFKVSKYVILRRCLDLGDIASHKYWEVFNSWRLEDNVVTSKSAGGGDYIKNQVSRLGKRLSALVLEALDNQAISTYEAQELLSLAPKHFSSVRELAFK
jgi:Zn-dependent peptidase ImmA (M78 family)